MKERYILAIDQSTQGTKALIFDEDGNVIYRTDLSHEQVINKEGWVSHHPMEIYKNTIQVVKNAVKESGIDKHNIVGVGISNQRETAVAWNRRTGAPVADAIVWQCSRAKDICNRIDQKGAAEKIHFTTGLHLSPYFPASKYAWFLEHIDEAGKMAEKGELCLGTIDSWLTYKLTGGRVFKTDYSNASRTQLLNLYTLEWDKDICDMFGIPMESLAQICDSNSRFGETDFEGFLDSPVPIHGILGDSHGALLGQGCLEKGMIKTTYGTGSSVMMNIGEKPIISENGVVTSLAWGMDGKVSYVLEGNINYTGAVISWMQKDLGIIESAKETELLAKAANKDDTTYLVPAFTGLGAPHWDSEAKALITGITRTTGKAEMVKAALECIAYQITDILEVMSKDSGIKIQELRVDGGPTRNNFLMQFQSDMAKIPVQVPDAEELSGIGAAYAAGLALHIYDNSIFEKMKRKRFEPEMSIKVRDSKYAGWLEAIKLTLNK
jgi:glycerol kinase